MVNEENKNEITSEEFMAKREKQLPEARKELHTFIDNMAKDGKYHFTVIAELVGELAEGFGCGFTQGYSMAIEDTVKETLDLMKKGTVNTDTPIDKVVAVVEHQIDAKLVLGKDGAELLHQMTNDIKEGILSPEQIADKYCMCKEEEYRDAVIQQIIKICELETE